MVSQKRNEWLDADSSEDNESGYDSAAEELRGKAASSAKRRKLNTTKQTKLTIDSDDDEGKSQPARIAAQREVHQKVESQPIVADFTATDQDSSDKDSKRNRQASSDPPKSKMLSTKSIAKNERKIRNSGVIYISRVPPFMKPYTVRQLLTPFGRIGKMFLTPEPAEKRASRLKAGGNKKHTFVDGWVEFESKLDAKVCVETLNAQPIGGKKGGWYRDDMWNLKYLKGFKWHHLTEQIANENAERASRMQAEIARTTRENKVFIANVEKGKMLDGIKAKRKAKQDEGGGAKGEEDEGEERFVQRFKQNSIKKRDTGQSRKPHQPEEVRRVLNKIF